MLLLVLALLLISLAIALTVNHKLRQAIEELEKNIETKTAQLQQEIETRKEAEQSCQDSRQQLQTIVDNASAVIYLKDIDSRLWLVNREFEQIFNLSKQQVTGKSDYEIFPKDTADAFKANDAVVVETKSALKTEEVITHPDGKKHTYLSLKFPLFDDKGNVAKIGGIATDITERKQLEEDLRRSESRFRCLIESNAVAVVLGASKGSITYANDAFLSLLGYERSDLERGALTWQNITAPEYLYLMDELDATHHYTSEQEYLHADGSRVPVLVSSAALEEQLQIIAVAIDIRDRLQTNRSLQSRLNQQAAVARLGQEALSGIELDELFDKAVALLAQNLEVEYAKVLELDRDGTTLQLRAGEGWHSGLVGRATVTADANSQAGYTLRSKQPVIIEDFRGETRFCAPALLVEHQVKSGISTILGKPERPFGVLGVHASQQRRFSQDDINFLQAIANILTAAVERFESAQTLQGSEARFRRLFDSNMIGIGRWQNDGKVVQANDALLELLGHPQPIEIDLGRLTPPCYSEADRRALQEIKASGTCKPYEKEYLRSDGKRIPVLVGGCSLDREQGFFFVVDMTERKQLELALQQSVARLETLHKLDRAILELQRPAATIRVAIACIEQLIPCQRAAIVTFKFAAGSANVSFASTNSTGTGFQLPLSSFASLIDRLEQGESFVEGTIDEVSSVSAALHPELQALKEEGLDRFVCFPLRASYDLLGVLQLWVQPEVLSDQQMVIAAEVSNQVAIALRQARLYQKVQRSNAELEQRVAQRTQQLQEINQELEAFTYSISHDLRAPLRALQGFATALLEDYGEHLDPLGQEYAQRLVGAAKNMEQLIQDLLAYSRLSRADLRLRSVSLAAVVAGVQEIESAQVTVETPLPQVHSNPTILSQVVSNLLSNALKFVAPGVEPTVRIWSETQQNLVRLYIQDNGVGISEEHSERIFKVFERLHSSETYPGTGIGLAIVRKGIERLGGRIGLKSTVGEGSCFWIELPASDKCSFKTKNGERDKVIKDEDCTT